MKETRDQGFYPEEYVWEKLAQHNASPYELARDNHITNSSPIKAADLVGHPDANLDDLLGLLGKDDPLQQYWGLLALGGTNLCESCYDDLRYTMGDEHPTTSAQRLRNCLLKTISLKVWHSSEKHSVITTLTPYFVRHELWN